MQEVMLKSQELMREVVWLGGGPNFQAADGTVWHRVVI